MCRRYPAARNQRCSPGRFLLSSALCTSGSLWFPVSHRAIQGIKESIWDFTRFSFISDHVRRWEGKLANPFLCPRYLQSHFASPKALFFFLAYKLTLFLHLSFELLSIAPSWLKPDMGKKAKHKTQIKKKTLNPEFNEVRVDVIIIL